MDKAPGCVSLQEAGKVLAENRSARAFVKRSLGPDKVAAAIELMRSGNLEGELGTEVHDLLLDAIQNEATTVWSGLIHQPHDDYGVSVHRFYGVYWVWAAEYDPLGYFLNRSKAIAFAKSNWWGDVEVTATS